MKESLPCSTQNVTPQGLNIAYQAGQGDKEAQTSLMTWAAERTDTDGVSSSDVDAHRFVQELWKSANKGTKLTVKIGKGEVIFEKMDDDHEATPLQGGVRAITLNGNDDYEEIPLQEGVRAITFRGNDETITNIDEVEWFRLN